MAREKLHNNLYNNKIHKNISIVFLFVTPNLFLIDQREKTMHSVLYPFAGAIGAGVFGWDDRVRVVGRERGRLERGKSRGLSRNEK
jgi:hypothetical protein